MSLSSDKQNIFVTIGSFVSLINSIDLPERTNLLSSINNKNDVIPFLLDILKTVAGTEQLKQLTGQLLTDFIDNVEPKMKSALKKQTTQFNSGEQLSPQFTLDGFNIPIKNIDISKKFKSSPSSDTGSLLYSDNSNTFDRKIFDSILTGNDITCNNMLLKYNPTTDSINFKPTLSSAGSNIGDWMANFIDDTVVVDKKEFLTNVMNTIYGSVTANQNKTVEQVYEELQISQLIEQLIQGDDSFEISPDELNKLLLKAQGLVDGVVYYDMGCGIVEAQLPLSGMTNLINEIKNSTDSNAVANAINDTIDESLENNPEVANENKETIKDGFFQKLIQAITLSLSQFMVTAPQIRALLGILSAFINDGVAKIGNALDDLRKFRTFLICIIRDVIRQIGEYIFDLVVGYLIALITPIIQQLIQEQINKYKNQLKTLVSSKL